MHKPTPDNGDKKHILWSLVFSLFGMSWALFALVKEPLQACTTKQLEGYAITRGNFAFLFGLGGMQTNK